MPDTNKGNMIMTKRMRLSCVIVGFGVCLFLFASCNSNHRQSQGHQDEANQTETYRANLSDNYDNITNLCDKMQSEGSSYWKQIDFKVRYHDGEYHIDQVYPYAAGALTDAVNKGYQISTTCLEKIKQGDDIYANLQEIDGKCYFIENKCDKGIEELRKDDEYISASMKSTWVSVLERLKKYSSEIRKQVQHIRDAQ